MLQSLPEFSLKEKKKTLVSLSKVTDTPVQKLQADVMITFCSSVKSDEFVDWTSFCSCLAKLHEPTWNTDALMIHCKTLQDSYKVRCVSVRPPADSRSCCMDLDFCIVSAVLNKLLTGREAGHILRKLQRQRSGLRSRNHSSLSRWNPPITMRGCGWLFPNTLRNTGPFLHCMTHNETDCSQLRPIFHDRLHGRTLP